MTEGYKSVRTITKKERPIEWVELNQLKKDILWVFDENGAELHNAYIPIESFTLPYWEYLTIDGDKWFDEEDKAFYREGASIILLCMVAEYIDLHGGNQQIFYRTPIADILAHANLFIPTTDNQVILKQILLQGLSIAASITDTDLKGIGQFDHPDLQSFYSQLSWIRRNFIIPYFQSKLQ